MGIKEIEEEKLGKNANKKALAGASAFIIFN